jgi:hypothetical protein
VRRALTNLGTKNPSGSEAPSLAEERVRRSRTSGRGLPWKARSHCEHGHEYTPENIAWRTDSSGRRCLACKRERDRRYHRERRAAARQGGDAS